MAAGDAERSIKVGIFLLITIVLLAAVVVLLGRTQNLFRKKAILHAEFDNTSGLVVGAPVRLAGVDIGIVQGIRFDPDFKEKKVHITLGVESQYLDRIRGDSVAHLSSKGLLGDMLINITVGSADKPAHKDGDELKSEESVGLTEIVDSLQEGINEIRGLTGKVDQRLTAVLTDDLSRDVGRIAHSTANVMEKVEKGNGLLHELIYDPRLARQAAEVVDEARGITSGLDRAVARVDRLVGAIETGDGTLHALIYGNEGKQALTQISHAARELDDVIGEIQKGRGLLHSLVYEEDRTNLIQNLTAMSKILRDVAEEVNQGKGTVGALLKDPSVYEDLKVILGNVKRNKLLKALVRFTIEKDHLEAPKVEPSPAAK